MSADLFLPFGEPAALLRGALRFGGRQVVRLADVSTQVVKLDVPIFVKLDKPIIACS